MVDSMVDSDQLRSDTRMVEDLLGQVVTEDEGPEVVQLVTEIRKLARERRTNVAGAEAMLSRRIQSLCRDSCDSVPGWAAIATDFLA